MPLLPTTTLLNLNALPLSEINASVLSLIIANCSSVNVPLTPANVIYSALAFITLLFIVTFLPTVSLSCLLVRS